MQTSVEAAKGSTSLLRNKRSVMVLSFVLMLQVAITAFLGLNEHFFSRQDSSHQLFSFDPKKVTKIIIEERNNDQPENSATKKLVLSLNEKSDWFLPDYYSFPASSDLIHKALEQLQNLKQEYLVGTTSDAAQRQKVSDGDFERAITLFQGDKKIGTLFVGVNLTADTVACRVSNDKTIFSVELSKGRFPAAADSWIDRRVTTTKVKLIAEIDLGAYKLVNYEEKWNLVEGGKTDLLSAETVKGVIYPAANCKITSVLGLTPKADYDLGHPILTCKMALKDGSRISYQVSKEKVSGAYVLKMSDFPWFCVAEQRGIDKIRLTSAAYLRSKEKSARTKPPDLRSMLKNSMQRVQKSIEEKSPRQ